jgi:hypothetical protein
VKNLCQSAILLRSGKMAAKGPVDEVISEYSRNLEAQDGMFPVRGKGIEIHSMDILQNGKNVIFIDGSEEFDIVVRFYLPERAEKLRMGVFINNSLGDELIRSYFTDWDPRNDTLGPGNFEARLTFPKKLLVAGNYTITIGAQRLGGFDMLAGHRVEKAINISMPSDFNIGGMSEPLRSQIILDRRWDVRKG